MRTNIKSYTNRVNRVTLVVTTVCDFPGESNGKVSVYNAGDPGSIQVQYYWSGTGVALEWSSSIAWKIPWTEEPGRLQPMGLQRVGHD